MSVWKPIESAIKEGVNAGVKTGLDEVLPGLFDKVFEAGRAKGLRQAAAFAKESPHYAEELAEALRQWSERVQPFPPK